MAIPLRLDLFHILQDAHRLTRRLESAAYKAIETAERARRADLEARGIIRRRDRPLNTTVPLPQAELEEDQAIAAFDDWYWLLGEIRQALEPITPTHQVVSGAETKTTLETVLELLREICHSDVMAFAAKVVRSRILLAAHSLASQSPLTNDRSD